MSVWCRPVQSDLEQKGYTAIVVDVGVPQCFCFVESIATYCPDDHEHTGWKSMEVTLNMSVDQVFDLLFTDTPFLRRFLEGQGHSGTYNLCYHCVSTVHTVEFTHCVATGM